MKLIQTPTLGLLISVPEGTKTLTIEGFHSELPLVIETLPLDSLLVKNCTFGGRPTWLGTLLAPILRRGWFRRTFHSLLYRTVPLPEGAAAWIEFKSTA